MRHWLLLNLLITIPAFIFLLRPGIYWNMHDDMQIIRQLEMDKCLHDGQVPCRWVPDLGYGYGYPLFNFYPPLPYYVGQVFRSLTFSYVDTVKLTAVTQIVLSSTFMFILASSLFGNLGGLLAAAFYTYAPYHAVDIYVRGAMNEAWALVFFPLIFYFSYRFIRTKKIIFLPALAIALSGLFLSHNPMVLIFGPFVAVWCLYWWWITNHANFRPLIYLSISGLFSLGLSAYFTLPVLFESHFVQIDSMFSNYYNYAVHFTTVYQLFISNFWGDGPSVWGPNDGMSFSVGYLHWLIPLVLIGYFLVLYIKKKKVLPLHQLTLLLILLGLFSVFMTHNKSTPIWQLFTPLQKLQFPWRFLNISTFILSLSVGLWPHLFLIKKIPRLSMIITTITVLTVIIINLSHFTPVTFGPITDAQKLSGKAWSNQITSGIYDYLPKTAKIAPQAPPSGIIDETSPPNSVTLISQKRGTNWLYFNLVATQKTSITVAQLYFPGFVATDFGQPTNIKVEPKLGRMVVDLAPGQHQLYFQLVNTPIRTISNFISILSMIITLLLIISISRRWIARRLT